MWFPQVHEEVRCDASTEWTNVSRRYEIDKSTFKINGTVADNEFAVDVPEGYKVIDSRGGKNITYAVFEKGELSLAAGGLDLDKMSWLQKKGVDIKKPQNTLGDTVRWILCIGGVVMILAAVIIVIIKKFRTLPLILLPLLLFMGCNAQPDIPQGKVTIEPATDKIGFNRMTR
ncbi:hypothetical protein FACS1894189_5830 [Planctomycetales bacterium]|nr:hypothetical protein FACS1894189_5830 [Planctomycetales bacterium]